MDQQLDAHVASDMAAKVRNEASDLAAETEKALHDKIDPSTPVRRALVPENPSADTRQNSR